MHNNSRYYEMWMRLPYILVGVLHGTLDWYNTKDYILSKYQFPRISITWKFQFCISRVRLPYILVGVPHGTLNQYNAKDNILCQYQVLKLSVTWRNFWQSKQQKIKQITNTIGYLDLIQPHAEKNNCCLTVLVLAANYLVWDP